MYFTDDSAFIFLSKADLIDAINNLNPVPTNNAIAAPITLDKSKSALKKVKNRKAPGPNGIIIEQYKLLNDENLTFVIYSNFGFKIDYFEMLFSPQTYVTAF